MPLEIEAKIKVDELWPIRDALEAAGAVRVRKVREVNTYFLVLDTDVGLRTRRETDEAGNVRCRVTYKGPKQPGRFKQREELEFDVSDADVAGEVLRRVGHPVGLIFEKNREMFRLGDCEVVLDELPELGCFVEVEGPGEESVQVILDRIGLGAAETISTGYASLVRSVLSKTGETELRFSTDSSLSTMRGDVGSV